MPMLLRGKSGSNRGILFTLTGEIIQQQPYIIAANSYIYYTLNH